MTLEQLQARLDAYLAAETTILNGGQEYTVGQGSTARRLTRADLATITSTIAALRVEINAAQPVASRVRRVSYLRPF